MLRNIIAVIIGLVIGSLVNMGVIMLNGTIIPLPEGVDPMDMENLKENMHLFKPIHFLIPFLAHTIGTLVGALTTGLIAVDNRIRLAVLIGLFFLSAGIANVFTLPAPAWFNAVDLIFAYLPMGWLGGKMAVRFLKKN